MDADGNDAVVVLAGLVEERIHAHPVEEDEHVAKQNGKRVTHELVLQPSTR